MVGWITLAGIPLIEKFCKVFPADLLEVSFQVGRAYKAISKCGIIQVFSYPFEKISIAQLKAQHLNQI
jgi:hypothetical protein